MSGSPIDTCMGFDPNIRLHGVLKLQTFILVRVRWTVDSFGDQATSPYKKYIVLKELKSHDAYLLFRPT